MRLADLAVPAAIKANHLAAFAGQKIDPPTEPPINLEAGRKAVHEHDGLTLAYHLIVDRHAARLNGRHGAYFVSPQAPVCVRSRGRGQGTNFRAASMLGIVIPAVTPAAPPPDGEA
jgi:hypothetical protein